MRRIGMRELRDSLLMEAKIIESNRANLPEGVLLRVQGLCQKVGIKNANGRLYPVEVWEHVFGDQNWTNKVKEGGMIGEADHPESNVPSIQRASHVIRSVDWDRGENVYATFDILDTPTGRILETLFKAGVKVGVSSRGDGSTRRDEEQSADIVEVGYIPDTWDFVINPSTAGAFPSPIHEAANAPEYQQAVIDAVEGTVNNSPSRVDLLECYTRLIALDSRHASIIEAKDILMGKIYEHLTTEEVNVMKDGQPVITPPVDPGITFMTEAVKNQMESTIRPLEEKLASSNQRIVELDQENKALQAQITEREDWQTKYDELVNKVGDISEAEENKKRLEAARTTVIPGLVAENERLQVELDAATELAGEHSLAADTNRIAAYIETAIARYPEAIKPQVRAVLEGAKDVVDVDRRLTSLETLGLVKEAFPPPAKATGGVPAEAGAGGHSGGGQLPPADTGEGVPAEAGALPPSKPWMPGQTQGSQREQRRNLRDRTVGAGRRDRQPRQPMTVAETQDRDRLPKPQSVQDHDRVVAERGAPTEREDGSSKVVLSLVESLGK